MLPPPIDPRTLQDLIDHMKEMVPYYTPEWRFSPDDPDPGTALFYLFADMYLQNVDRMNRVPVKNMIAFLNLLDLQRLTARPARGYVTFTLSEGTPHPVLVPRGTEVAAKDEEGAPVVFQTDHAMLVTPARIAETFLVSARQDRIVCLTERLAAREAVTIFDVTQGQDEQAHALYIGHHDLLWIDGMAEVEVQFFNSKERHLERTCGEWFADPERVEWRYLGAQGWEPFEEVTGDGNRLWLRKKRSVPFALDNVNGIENRWLRARLLPTSVPQGSHPLLIDGLRLKTQSIDEQRRGGFAPELLFANDQEADPAGCFPFGEFLAPYSLLYLASDEAFSKKDSLIELSMRLKAIHRQLMPVEEPEVEWKLIMKDSDIPKAPKIYLASIRSVVWEYWNGKSWARLTNELGHEELFYRPLQEGIDVKVRFRCPDDLAETFVNGHFKRFIRVRVQSVDNLYTPNPVHLSPWVENVRLQYRYEPDVSFPAERLLADNNMQWSDGTPDLTANPPRLFLPFAPLDTGHPGLYLGFDAPPTKGPLHLYFSLRQQNGVEQNRPIVDWEYLRREGDRAEWATLKTVDETLDFTRSGAVQFVGPSDFTRASLFRRELFWIRAVNRDNRYDSPATDQKRPILQALHLNTVRVTQQETLRDESPKQVSLNDTEVEFQLAHAPVFSEEVWVDETGHVTERGVQELQEAGIRTEVVRDVGGNLLKLWVHWQAVDHIGDASGQERVYRIDRTAGTIRFGDGRHGKRLPDGGSDRIRVHSNKIAGKKGNVPAAAIHQMQRSIAFVQSVTNAEPTAGGCDTEPLSKSLQRGPQTIRHRDRAVTAQDYEWLAREAYPDLAKVKTFAGYDGRMKRKSGCVTLAVLPSGGGPGLPFFPELKRQIEEYLQKRSATSIAMTGRVEVIEPAYLKISVFAELVVKSMDDVVPAEREAIEKLNHFLNPFTGNYDGKGWEIGQQIHASVLYGLLKSVVGINHVQKLSMTVHRITDGQAHEVRLEEVSHLPHGIVINGRHQIVVDLV
ncbi:putative baseplate assembly protein [Tumebacillus permanentifrigoris]|uniref:Putative phage baseplate assembly protein n=1 Tax=Tumebacillus permanentifrigoris TaxID=378543 RepID=A0A316D9C2_9BACL|nr:putative baseplate assembly protein [Tumebacillus permanentifrigoris]PWK11532.1 putative phage baseplate assembly protein [Tumebacillus permanentifrigoris]